MKVLILVIACLFVVSYCAFAEDIKFDFEDGKEGWDIPDWAREQYDHVGTEINISDEVASSGEHSLAVIGDFPGDEWRAVVVEYRADMDLTGYTELSADIFLPKKARGGLYQARFIVVAGPWWIIEQRYSTPLEAGKWTTITAKLDVTMENELMYWKRKTKEASLTKHLGNMRKIIVRVEYNANESQGGPRYKGPIYIDNVIIKE